MKIARLADGRLETRESFVFLRAASLVFVLAAVVMAVLLVRTDAFAGVRNAPWAVLIVLLFSAIAPLSLPSGLNQRPCVFAPLRAPSYAPS